MLGEFLLIQVLATITRLPLRLDCCFVVYTAVIFFVGFFVFVVSFVAAIVVAVVCFTVFIAILQLLLHHITTPHFAPNSVFLLVQDHKNYDVQKEQSTSHSHCNSQTQSVVAAAVVVVACGGVVIAALFLFKESSVAVVDGFVIVDVVVVVVVVCSE